ncbi:hypothetical protein PS1_033165 [Malus domestica]
MGQAQKPQPTPFAARKQTNFLIRLPVAGCSWSKKGIITANKTIFKAMEGKGKGYLAGEGTVGIEPGVAPRDQPEIDGGDETVLEDLDQPVDNEVCTVRTQSFVVESH